MNARFDPEFEGAQDGTTMSASDDHPNTLILLAAFCRPRTAWQYIFSHDSRLLMRRTNGVVVSAKSIETDNQVLRSVIFRVLSRPLISSAISD